MTDGQLIDLYESSITRNLNTLSEDMYKDYKKFVNVFDFSLRNTPVWESQKCLRDKTSFHYTTFVIAGVSLAAGHNKEISKVWSISADIIEELDGNLLSEAFGKDPLNKMINITIEVLNMRLGMDFSTDLWTQYERLYRLFEQLYKETNMSTLGLTKKFEIKSSSDLSTSLVNVSKSSSLQTFDTATKKEDIYNQMLNHPAAKYMMWCPSCGQGKLVPMGESTGGFSGKKALAGAALVGPVGLVAGALGKKQITYECFRCHYIVTR